ncbi:MAG: Uma2 family endonuclease [Bacteroidota bacterium]
MSLALKYLPRYNYDDYIGWEGNWELIEGIPYAMSPPPIRKHQRIIYALANLVTDSLENCAPCEVLGELDWIIDDNTVVRPDLFIDCEKSDDDFLRNTPVLIVEVLSPSTAVNDRNLKYELYEKQGVKYYLIIDPIGEQVEIFELKQKTYKKQGEFKEGSFDFDLGKCTSTINFKEIW